jgi:hypothetical protein
MTFASFDLSNYPLVVVTLCGTPRDECEFESYLEDFKKLYKRKKTFCLIIDSRNVGWIPFTYLYRQAMFLKEVESLSRKYITRTAIIITTKLADCFLQSIFYIQPPVSLTETFDDYDIAKKWVVKKPKTKTTSGKKSHQC